MITLEPPRSVAEASDPWRELGLSKAGLSRFVRAAQTQVGLRGEIAVLLADDRMLRRLNREYRGKNKATDVLSFPAMEELAEVTAGDLAVSLETAQKQADEHGHDLATELRVLLLHGMLHLNGMDHEVDSGEMAAREAELRKKLRLPNGLIARVEAPKTQAMKDAAKKAARR
ncbi:rRNA maturation RNase YbeY [Granulicella cerasi]|uniref:Endoribonuclease YbeY n=1 Tax=Granulicella cerasi TaxID=741063 RepID=A0ABW1ZFD1_9BACT|nr:rRNA maturation RNase YbeY [Granulicella cerasi]